MATIVGGIATSHTPTIGFALDANKQQDSVWAPIFEGYKPVQKWLASSTLRRFVMPKFRFFKTLRPNPQRVPPI